MQSNPIRPFSSIALHPRAFGRPQLKPIRSSVVVGLTSKATLLFFLSSLFSEKRRTREEFIPGAGGEQ